MSSLFLIVTFWPFFPRTLSFDFHAINCTTHHPSISVIYQLSWVIPFLPWTLLASGSLSSLFLSYFLVLGDINVHLEQCYSECYLVCELFVTSMNWSKAFVPECKSPVSLSSVFSSADFFFFFDEGGSILVYIIWHKLLRVLWYGTWSNIDLEDASNILTS